MSLNKRQKEELSDKILTLLEAGYLDDDLSLTSFGETQLLNYLLEENMSDMVKDAARVLDKRKSEDDDDDDIQYTIGNITIPGPSSL